MRRTKEDADLTRQGLLKAGLIVFSQKGFDGTRLEDIARAAGVTRGAIYHHFGNKADLFKELVKDAQVQGGQMVLKAINEGGSFGEITQRVLVYSMQLLEEDEHFRGVMSLLLYKTGSSSELGDFPYQRDEESQAQMEAIADFFRMGLKQQAVRAELDPLVAARAFIAYQNGLILLWLAAPKAFSIKEEASALADVFVHGIIP